MGGEGSGIGTASFSRIMNGFIKIYWDMTREIKFRCWYGGKMMIYESIMSYSNFIVTPDGIVLVRGEDGYANGKERNAVLMQFTGLKDKNGKEIYEGDIIEMQEEYSGKGRPSYKKMKGEVFWDTEAACFLVKNKDGWQSDIVYPIESGVNLTEIIGNKWENPELLP